MIEAKIICDSIANDIQLTSIQSKAPMFLDAEFEKHRRLSNISSNSSSNRAIPFLKMLDQGYFLPNDIRLNQPGMQGDLLLDDDSKEEFWNDLKDIYGYTSEKLKKWDKVHKQHLNRYLAGFYWQHKHKICTGTDWENFWNLRVHPDADPAMYEVARKMKNAMDESTPVELKPGEWHLPYINEDEICMAQVGYSEPYCINLDDLIKCSVARCARVSYNNHDNSSPNIEKDIALADKLLAAGHMSPFEHIATPMEEDNCIHPEEWELGVTHMDHNKKLWSGNFRGWIQYRQLIEQGAA